MQVVACTSRPLPPASELRARADIARRMLDRCELCELRCGVNRNRGERGTCGLDYETFCFKRHISFAEELAIIPSYMVYFGGCNFRCSFCVQAPECFKANSGVKIDVKQTAHNCIEMMQRGAKTVNLLGGEPTLHLHAILDIAAVASDVGGTLTLAINSNMYMSPEVIQLLDGVASMYIADYKFGNDACAKEIARVSNYTSVVQRNFLHASQSAPLIVRHLLMPGHSECCLRPFAAWMAQSMPGTPVTLMDAYVPAYRAPLDASIGRLLNERETRAAHALLQEYNITEAV